MRSHVYITNTHFVNLHKYIYQYQTKIYAILLTHIKKRILISSNNLNNTKLILTLLVNVY